MVGEVNVVEQWIIVGNSRFVVRIIGVKTSFIERTQLSVANRPSARRLLLISILRCLHRQHIEIGVSQSRQHM